MAGSGSLMTVDDRAVQAVLRDLRNVGQNFQTALAPTVRRHMLAAETRARMLTPREQPGGFLSRSGRSGVEVLGNTLRGHVTFGGMASAYAEVQHENESYAHTPEQYAAKYGKPLNRTGYSRQTLRGKVGRGGRITISSKVWKYKRKRAIRGYRGGHAHFLHGKPNSAWNPAAAARLNQAVEHAGEQALQQALAQGKAD
jgi:hypothetical protein